MKNPKKAYEVKRDSILKSKKISEAEKSNQLFGNWINYISNSVTQSENNSIKYEAEKIRVHVRC